MIYAVLTLVAAYVLGSIPTGYWVAKAVKGIDIRNFGSGSTGATNVLRCVGKKWGAFVFAIDILKGYVPAAVAVMLDQGIMAQAWSDNAAPHMVPALTAGAALIGHSKSIFLNFTGGKSAATGLGTLFGLNPLGGFITLVIWVSLVASTRIVSLASMLAVAACPVAFFLLKAPLPFVAYCTFGFIYVTFRHRANVKRLLNGTEPRLGDKPKELVEEQEKPVTETETLTKDQPQPVSMDTTELGEESAQSAAETEPFAKGQRQTPLSTDTTADNSSK